MSFDILYLEDETGEQNDLKAAIARHNTSERGRLRRLSVTPISDPDELASALDRHFDLILADLHFPKGKRRTDEFQLLEIIEIVKKWSVTHDKLKPPPIIAYTRRQKVDLKDCLAHRADLYDIWDKGSASPDYVAWRLSSMAVDLARSRPDALLERLIRTMDDPGLPWHKHVVKMARQYGAAWSETDQIERAGLKIALIADKLDAGHFATKNWHVMEKWEPLGRAVSQRTRGHARHVINVFWLGYFLLQNSELSKWFHDAWQKLPAKRKGDVARMPPLRALNEIWFYAGLFHDIANCVQEYPHTTKETRKLMERFDRLVASDQSGIKVKRELKRRAAALLKELGENAKYVAKPWRQSVINGEPDHGMVAAVQLTSTLTKAPHGVCAREAARAMLLHNMVGKLDDDGVAFLDWNEDPMVCLLLLCDQIQTWDRERGDTRLLESEGPERAALTELQVMKVDGSPVISIWIEYIPPVHLDQNPDSFDRVKEQLENVLEKKVKPALKRIKEPWPFAVLVQFRLSGEPLDTVFSFRGPVGEYVPPVPDDKAATTSNRPFRQF